MAALLKKLIWVFPLFFMITVSAWAADNVSSDQSTDKGVSLKDLGTQMKAMQEEINRLREEAEVRNKLEATVEEKTDHEKEILSAAGQDYSLPKEGNLEVTYGFNYAYNDTDVLESLKPSVDHSSNHNIVNSVMLKYSLMDNFCIDSTVPFIYKSDQRSTTSEKNATDIGDLSFGAIWQPKKSDGDKPTVMFNGSMVLPTGTSPYKIDVNNALSTGSGFYSISAGASISKSLDPVFAFGSVSIYYPFNANGLSQRRSGPNPTNEFELKKVAPGNTIGISIGIAYALSYTVSLNTSLSYAYTTAYKYTWNDGAISSSGASTSAVFNVGTGWRISPERTISTSLGIGLTNAASRFTFSFSIPYEFKL